MRCSDSRLRHTVIQMFFFNDTATTEIYTLSLHDALPILMTAFFILVILGATAKRAAAGFGGLAIGLCLTLIHQDRKSTRLNSSHSQISYAVFCLKKKKNPSASRP